MSVSATQSVEDRRRILKDLPEGTRRVQVLRHGKQHYKKPEEIDVEIDEVVLSSDGSPVVMKGRPGRKPKSRLQPISPMAAEIDEARTSHIEDSTLRKEADKDSEGEELFNQIISSMAEEAAALEFEREEAARHGLDTSGLSVKRSRVLKAMADSMLKRKSLTGGIIDLDSPAFQALFTLLLESFKESMDGAGCRSEQVEAVFASLIRALADESWKQEAKSRMKEKLA